MSLSKAGRPGTGVEQFQDIIYKLYIVQEHCAAQVIMYLQDEHDFTISKRTFNTAIVEWEFTKSAKFLDTPELRAQISMCYELLALEDSQIIHVLQDEGIFEVDTHDIR
jgi:hypothetical protein